MIGKRQTDRQTDRQTHTHTHTRTHTERERGKEKTGEIDRTNHFLGTYIYLGKHRQQTHSQTYVYK